MGWRMGQARPSLAVSHVRFLQTLPLEAKVMERHPLVRIADKAAA